jgi:uncharacterized protein with HEPN domain
MLASNIELLRHIIQETSFILKYSKGISKDDFINNDLLCHALVRSLEIIGEASKKIDPDFKSNYPQIEWRKIAGTRDKMIHDYFGIDYEIVWDIIENKIPELDYFIREMMDENIK